MIQEKIKILVKSSRIIYQLNKIGIKAKIGDDIIIPITSLWSGSNIKVEVTCDICGNKKKIRFQDYLSNIKKWNFYTCSNKCAMIKNKKTSLVNYGTDNPQKLEIIKSEIKKTNLERYGVEYPMMNNNIHEKSKKTNLEKYGVECTLKSDIILNKIKKTMIERYGVEYPMMNDEIYNKIKKTMIERYDDEKFNNREKYKKTCLERYGVDSINKLQETKDKKIKTYLMRFGFINNSMSEICKNKLKKTNLERYGVEYPMQNIESFNKQRKSAFQIKKYNETLYYQGTYELDFLNYINNKNMIDLIEQDIVIDYVYNKKNKKYYPDFFIKKYNLIIEIKSRYIYYKELEKNIAKINKCLADGYNFILIIDKKYTYFDEIIKEIIKQKTT